MRRGLVLVALSLVALLAIAGCGGASGAAGGASGNDVSTKLSEMKFDPNSFTVTSGQPVKVTAQNVGTVRHDFVVRGFENETKLVVEPGKTESKTFTIGRAGAYEVFCSEPGHEAAGMKGTLTVK